MTRTTNNQQRTLFKTNPNKAKVKIGKMNISVAKIKDYDNEQQTTNNERYSKQSQFSNPARLGKIGEWPDERIKVNLDN
ncbi:MAG: hypothetical protein ACYS9C_13625 [Planctomycetota bacterium]|jgi:hypothetical protein